MFKVVVIDDELPALNAFEKLLEAALAGQHGGSENYNRRRSETFIFAKGRLKWIKNI